MAEEEAEDAAAPGDDSQGSTDAGHLPAVCTGFLCFFISRKKCLVNSLVCVFFFFFLILYIKMFLIRRKILSLQIIFRFENMPFCSGLSTFSFEFS